MDYNSFKNLSVDVAIQEAAKYSGFSPEEIRGVWNTESAMGANKGPSQAGAVGDFQIMPTTQASLEGRFGVKFDPMDFHDSLFMGMEVLRENLAHFKNKADALRAYNSGWDQEKWNNPETLDYPGKVLGQDHPELAGVYAATDKLPSFTQSTARLDALNESGIVDTDEAGYATLDNPYPAEVEFPGLYDDTARKLANDQLRAGFSESALDAMVFNTITGKIFEVSQRGELDPDFDPMSDENKQRLQDAGLYGNDMMMDYMLGSRNTDDFGHRIEVARERVDLFRRAANNPGWSATAGTLLGSMADPVGIMTSVGIGAGAAVVRGAAAASRASRIATAGAAGAAENAAVGIVLNEADNQRFSWSTLIQDGTLGMALGALGGAMVRPDGLLHSDPGVRVPDDFRAFSNAAARAAQEVSENATQRAWDSGLSASDAGPASAWDGTVSTSISDFGGSSVDLVGPQPIRKVQAEDGSVSFTNVPEEPRLVPANAYNARLGYKPVATLSNSVYRDLHSQGVITELRSADDLAAVSAYQRRYGTDIPDDAKAVYIPQDDRVYVFRDRLSQTEADSPMGLVMHEVGVHYGLERAVGTEAYNRILKSLDESNDARVKSALRAVPGDTPEHLRLEEALGYLVEKHPNLPLVKRVIADLRNWLRDNVRMLRGMAITAEDAIAYVQGSVQGARQGAVMGSVRADGLLYSRSQSGVSTLPLSEREKAVLSGLEKINATVDANHARQIERTQAMLNKRPEFMKDWNRWAESPGVAMSTSPNELARKTSAMFFENSMGSAGRPEDGSVAMHYDLLYRAYRDATLEQVSQEVTQLMTPRERASHMFGGTAALRRISTEVAEERLKHRMAVSQGRKHVSSAPEGIQRLAKILDDQMFRMVDDGKAYGSSYADKVFGSGVVGFMPQAWDWRKFHAAQTTDPATWQALKDNFTQQYVEKQIDPVLKELREKGTPDAEVDAVRERLLQQVEHQVNTRMLESVRDPHSRTSKDTGKFELMASELLYENFQGTNITRDVIQQFKEILGDHINDRSRTEFDLLREVNGVRLLDYVEHDLATTVAHTAHRFAGQNAMAKRGFKDYADFEALITLLTKTGARPVDIELTQFAGRAFGFQPMVIGDSPVLATLRNFTYAAMLGKLGIAQLADMSAMITATGMGSLPRIFGGMLSKEAPLVKQLGRLYGPGMIGADYRIQSYVADVLPNGRALGSMSNHVLKASQRAAQFVSWINGSNFITRALHKAFLPIVAEDVVRAAQGLDGGMSPARLADIGLNQQTLDRIKAQIAKYEPNRKEGDAFNWEAWDDQYAADKLVEAMHRATSQVFNRTMVGEAAMWRTESQIGSLVGQFHNYGLTAMEKQLGRNLSINDLNTYMAMVMGIAWSSFLYYSRIQLNAAGMNPDDAQEYIERNTTAARMTQGMLTYFNMSGIGAELFDMGSVLFGGNAYQGGSGAVAGMGYLSNAAKSLNGIGNILTGEADSTGKELSKVLRILPGGNSIPGTWMVNRFKDE